MKCNFTVGQKVACIVDWNNRESDIIYPERNKIYTISNIVVEDEAVWVGLTEIPTSRIGKAVVYEHSCFAPLQERKITVFDFEALLTPVKLKELV
jgi:hypothetical protein